MTAGSLAGLLVIDVCPSLPGQLCAAYLGDLGARVIKIERPRVGDPTRGRAYGSFEASNRNKESVTLDLKRRDGVNALHRIVSRADVFLEGFQPGVAQRLGAGWPALKEVNPKLVYCSISGYGQTGPYRDRPGHEKNFLGVSGFLATVGEEGRPEGNFAASITDVTAALFACVAVLAAVRARESSGAGQFIDVALADAAYALVATRMYDQLVTGMPPSGVWNRPGMGVFSCSDGRRLTLAAVDDPSRGRLASIVGLPSIDDNEGLETALRSRPRDEWLTALAAGDVPCGPVNDLREAAADVQARARDVVTWVEHPTLGRLPQLVFAPKLDANPPGIRSRPPLLGEHTAAVLAEAGLSPSEIAGLSEGGVT